MGEYAPQVRYHLEGDIPSRLGSYLEQYRKVIETFDVAHPDLREVREDVHGFDGYSREDQVRTLLYASRDSKPEILDLENQLVDTITSGIASGLKAFRGLLGDDYVLSNNGVRIRLGGAKLSLAVGRTDGTKLEELEAETVAGLLEELAGRLKENYGLTSVDFSFNGNRKT